MQGVKQNQSEAEMREQIDTYVEDTLIEIEWDAMCNP